MDITTLQTSQYTLHFSEPHPEMAEHVHIQRVWDGGLCRSSVMNAGQQSVRLREVVLFAGPLMLPPTTGFYGEGFQTLSQTVGTLAAPVAVSKYTDHEHYRLPQMSGMITAYNAVLLQEPSRSLLMAFTSCRRFNSTFRLNAERFEIALDTEDLTLAPGQSWELRS